MEHQRIDEGIKRGALSKSGLPRRRPAEGKGWTIPADLDPDLVLQEYLTAAKTSAVAKRHGLYRGALTRWLQKVRPNAWKEVQVIRALCTKEDGTEQLYDAVSALQLSRGRELRRASEWDLERLDSANYGQKQEITHNLQPILTINLSAVVAEVSVSTLGPVSEVIDGAAQVVQLQQDGSNVKP